MLRSNLTRVVAGMVLFAGVMEVPIGASFIAQQRVDSPSEQARRPVSSQSSSAAQTQTTSIEYKNAQYGFCFSLPESWRGYSVLVHRWTGFHNTGGPRGVEDVTSGPVISIRHPRWTSEDPRQDIPIMVFTVAQWNALEKGDFYASAAPIGPGELGRNRKYVFALPPRFDYAFPTGYEEVEQILRGTPLHVACRTFHQLAIKTRQFRGCFGLFRVQKS